MFTDNAIFKGKLIHRRYLPVRHELVYEVADVLVDVDRLDELNSSSWLIGHNRKRLFGIDDKNHALGDGASVAVHIRKLFDTLKSEAPIKRIFMLCYPAVLGKVFNPLTVYFGLGEDGRWLGVIYEVSNTFGQRHAYVLPVEDGNRQRAEKCFYVSPFNKVEGEYRFSIERTSGALRLNIALFEDDKLKFTARFEGQETPLTDRALLSGLMRLALQPMKVWSAIHWEALKLYLKGLRPTPRPPHATYAITSNSRRTPAP